MPVAIVSPYTHLVGHYAVWTTEIIQALKRGNYPHSLYTSLSFSPPYASLIQSSCCPWTKYLFPLNLRARHWGNPYDNLLRNIEFYFCLKEALKTPRKTHIYCLDARHKILLNAVLNTKRSFSHLCLGGPERMVKAHNLSVYKKAFATGRLTFIVETEAVRSAWEAIAGGHVVHIPIAIPLEDLLSMPSKVEARKKLNLPQDKFICLFFGTHREGKDYQTAVEAAQLSACKPFLYFSGPLISGNDPQEIIKKSGYSYALVRNRYCSDDEMKESFAAADFILLPYQEGYTKGSGVLLQACQFNRPVIASDTGHLADFIKKHQSGLLYEPGSPVSLSHIYDRAASMNEAEKKTLEENILKVRNAYSWEKILPKYLKIFENSDS